MKAIQGVTIIKDTPERQELQVPIKISVSSTPLYIKVILNQGFPVIGPQIAVLSDVSHQSIEPGTQKYIGSAIQGWHNGSQLYLVVQQIQNQFNMQPPVPRRAQQ